MVVGKTVFPTSMELKHRSDYAGPNSKSIAWIFYFLMLEADCPINLCNRPSKPYFTHISLSLFSLPTPELCHSRDLHHMNIFAYLG